MQAGDLGSLIAPADPEVILLSLIAGEGKLIAIISALAAECDPAVPKTSASLRLPHFSFKEVKKPAKNTVSA